MRKAILSLLTAVLCVGCNNPTQDGSFEETDALECVREENVRLLSRTDTLVCLANAFARQESRYNYDAVSPCGRYVGCLQISGIMVAEANRIAGFECFYTDDRYDRGYSYEIFKVVQEYHNPMLSVEKSVEIWNRNAPLTYRNNIEQYFFENLEALRNNELQDYFEIL